mgnify:CR=1 FL=1
MSEKINENENINTFFWFELVLEARAEILQNFQLLFGLIDDFVNSFRLNLTFSKEDWSVEEL